MDIPLDKFELVIDETILKRGLAYFQKGLVTEVVKLSNGNYEGLVSGSENYTIRFKIKNDVVLEPICDCPYDYGPVCKHIAAVIFYIHRDSNDMVSSPAKKSRSTKKRSSFTQQLKQILKKISLDELETFIQDYSKKDQKFRNYFLTVFSHHNTDQSKDFFKKQIQNILKASSNRQGWIGWSEMKYVVTAMQLIEDNVYEAFNRKDYGQTFMLCTAIIEEIYKAFQFADDSNGDLGYYISFSFEKLNQIKDSKISNKLRLDLMNYCLLAFKNGDYDGWDWHIDCVLLASKLVTNEKEADEVIQIMQESNSRSDYFAEQLVFIQLELFDQYKPQKIIQTFIKQNIRFSRVREQVLENEIKEKRYKQAILLAQEGIKQDQKDKPGVARRWHEYLLKISQLQEDVERIIQYARYLFIVNFHPEQDYYQILKDHIPSNEWVNFVEKMVEDLYTKKKWPDTNLIRSIYIQEHWWDRLFILLKENCSFSSIVDNEKYLKQDYAKELLEMYASKIKDYLEYNIGRSHYRTVCRHIRRMKKLNGIDEANSLISFLREEYPQRRALIDELNKV